jgi:hypothetical protein
LPTLAKSEKIKHPLRLNQQGMLVSIRYVDF